METNKLTPSEKFIKDVQLAMHVYYRQSISENVRRGLLRKKLLSPRRGCNVKQCKV